jgi:hypothetical protein
MIHKLLTSLFIAAGFLSSAYAQDFGGHPASLEWKQIDTDSVRVIFPKGMEEQAKRSASLIHYMYANNKVSIGEEASKVDIVFRNQTVMPNGFVSLPLFRSEFFTTPPSTVMLSALDWNDALTIHEYRHVLQYLNARKGMGEFMYWLSGEPGWAGFVGLMVPSWFMEGDAVVTETALTNSGRGRTPHFSLDMRAMLLQDKAYNYMKARNNSFKDMVPDHYQMGYVLSTYIRKHYGNDVWKNVLADVTKLNGLVYPFSRNLEKHTGMGTRKLYRNAYTELQQELKEQVAQLDLTPSERLSLRRYNTFTNYRHPQMTEEGDLLAIKSSYKEISTLVRIRDGKEEKLVDLGPSTDPHLTYSKGKVAWTEVTYDPRWSMRDYSVVVTYDLKTKEKRYLTQESKYFSPQLSADGKRLLVVEMDELLKYKLKILDAVSGKVLQEIQHPDNLLLRYPRWSDDEQAVISLAHHNSQFFFVKYSLQQQQWEQVGQATAHIMTQPYVGGKHLYFSASFSGIDNIYALDMETEEVFQLTSVPIGAYNPTLSADNKQLIFREYDSIGFEVKSMNLKEGLWEKVQIKEPYEMGLFDEEIAKQEGGNVLDKFPVKNFEVTDYSAGIGGMKLHSWMPFASVDWLPFATASRAGVNFMTENLLHTWQTDLGFVYNFNDSVATYSFDVNYGGFYPLLSAGVEVQPGFKRSIQSEEEISVITQDRYTAKAGVTLPLNFSKGAYYRSLNMTGQLRHSWFNYQENQDFNRQLTSLRGIVTFHNIKRRALQQVKPRFGQSLSLVYDQEIGVENFVLMADGTFYFPGFWITHNIYPQIAYRWKHYDENRSIDFGDVFTYARGYNRPNYDKMRDVVRASVNYHMPLFYPDFGFAGLLYLSRVRSNFFYDFSMTNPVQQDKEFTSEMYRSAGGEIFLDLQGFNNRALQIGVGMRTSYRFDQDPLEGGEPLSFEIIFANIL